MITRYSVPALCGVSRLAGSQITVGVGRSNLSPTVMRLGSHGEYARLLGSVAALHDAGANFHASQTSSKAFWLALLAAGAGVWVGHCKCQRTVVGEQSVAGGQQGIALHPRKPESTECENASSISLHAASHHAATAAGAAAALQAATLAPAVPAACQETPVVCHHQQDCLKQLQQEQLVLQKAFDSAKPAVVQVYSVAPGQPQKQAGNSDRTVGGGVFKDQQERQQFRFLGSGFFFDERGYIVTAAHVILGPNGTHGHGIASSIGDVLIQGENGSDSVPLRFAVKDSEGRLLAASLCGIDTATDVAVLRVEGTSARTTPSFQGKFSASRPLMGEVVATYASTEHADEPIGVAGRVLQPRQSFKTVDASESWGFLQLQLLTLPGMSGAPVFNMDGVLVGMLVKKFDVCGLALASTIVLRVAEALRDSGTFVPPSIGMLVEEEGLRFASPPGERSTLGLKICAITPGSAAADAGLREGDRIISANGEKTDSVGRLREIILLHRGGPMYLKVERGKDSLEVRMEVSALGSSR